MTDKTLNPLVNAVNVDDALAALANAGSAGVLVAGGTWVMRAPIRQEPAGRFFVSLNRIDALKQVESTKNEISIGALVTHDALAKMHVTGNDLHCLKQAASKSANPAIRNVATIGGNVCTSQFAAADLVPALLCLDANVEIHGSYGHKRLSIDEYLSTGNTRPHGEILTKIIIPRSNHLSAHARLLMRKAGEYPVVNTSCSLALTDDGTIQDARIMVGSVEDTVKRWDRLEAAVSGQSLMGLQVKEIATGLTGDFEGRDGPDAPGHYRLKVLPKVAAQAFADIQHMYEERA